MRKTTYSESAHTATTTHPLADPPAATSGLPNRLMTAFEVAEFVGCHEETVRRAYLRGVLVSRALRTRWGVSSDHRVRFRTFEVRMWDDAID